MRTGRDKPLANLDEAAAFLKALSKSSAKHFPTTSERLMEIVRLLRQRGSNDPTASLGAEGG